MYDVRGSIGLMHGFRKEVFCICTERLNRSDKGSIREGNFQGFLWLLGAEWAGRWG